jgi:hypothetical protein
MAIDAYREKINNLQNKIAKDQENVKIQVVTEYKDKIKTIIKKEKEYVYQATNDVPAQYTLSSGWVYLHDIAATGGDANSTLSANDSSSGVKDDTAVATIVQNYSICRQNSEQLKSLQTWLTETQNSVALNNNNK